MTSGSLHKVAASMFSLTSVYRHGLRVVVLFDIDAGAVSLSRSFRMNPWEVPCIKRRPFNQCNQLSRTHPAGSTSRDGWPKSRHSITLSEAFLLHCSECRPSTGAAAGKPFSLLPQPVPSWGQPAESRPAPSS